jgi:uncharacterized protein
VVTEPALAYLDSSALVKLAVEERESTALQAALSDGRRVVASELAIIEVARAVGLAHDAAEAHARWLEVRENVTLLTIDAGLLDTAAGIASRRVRSLDAIHLASALRVEPDVLITYDGRMAEAARELAIPVEQPGAWPGSR